VIIPSYENIYFESFDGKWDKRFNGWEFDAFQRNVLIVYFALNLIEKACISEKKYTPLK
jgi:hypothetical protein